MQPNGPPAVTVTQINPIQASFTLPEKELAGLRGAMSAGPAEVRAVLEGGAGTLTGKLVFIDNTVDSGTGTIRVKAEFDNESARLWPGMYVNMEVAPRTIAKAAVVPVQAVQTGPDSRFVFVVGADRKVTQVTVKLLLVDGPIAVIDGVAPGARVVTEGAQNLRPGSLVAEAEREGDPKKPEGPKGEGKKAA